MREGQDAVPKHVLLKCIRENVLSKCNNGKVIIDLFSVEMS